MFAVEYATEILRELKPTHTYSTSVTYKGHAIAGGMRELEPMLGKNGTRQCGKQFMGSKPQTR
jgi:hypothetical protein